MVALVVVVLVLTNTPWGNEQVRRILVSQTNGRLTGRLDVARLRGNLLSGATLTDVRIVDSARQPLFSARRVQVRYGIWAALHRRVVLESVVLDTPFIMMDKRPGARWNFQTLVRPSNTPQDTSTRGASPEIGDVVIHHGQFVYRRPWRPDSTLPADKRDAAIAAALGSSARNRTERVPGGFQRIVEYHDIDAHVPEFHLAHGGQPTFARIAALSMIAEPYRPPPIEVRSLTATLYFSKDSLWWRGARMALPASQVTGDGRIGLNGSGFVLRLDAGPVAFADMRWLNPRFPADGGGRLQYTMRVHGDTAEYAVAGADLRYREATVAGSVSLARVHPAIGVSTVLVRSADVVVARLTTATLRELAPSLKLYRRGTIDGRAVVSGTPDALHLDADLQFDDARSGRSRLVARGGLGIGNGLRARDLNVDLRPLRLATLAGTPAHVPLGGVVSGSATINGASLQGWHVRGDLTHVDGASHSRVAGDVEYRTVGKRVLADARLEPLSLATVGHLFPSAGLRGSVTGRVHAEGTTRDLRVSGALHSANGGTLDLRGVARLAGVRTRYDVAAALDALDVSSLSRRAPRTSLSGTLTARGGGISLASADVALTANLRRSSYDTLFVDRLLARLTASDGLLRVDTLVVDAAGAEAHVAGTLGLVAGRSGDMRVAVAIDSLGALRRWLGTSDSSRVVPAAGRQGARLAAARADSARRAEAVRIERLALGLPPGVPLVVDTLPSLRRDSLSGSVRADATLHGNVKHLGIDAHVAARDVVIRGNAARSVSAALSSTNVRDAGVPLTFRADVQSMQAGGYELERARAAGRWQQRTLSADVTVRQDSLVDYAASGSVERPSAGVQQIRLDSLVARFDTLLWQSTRPARVTLDHGAVALDSIELRSNRGGRLFADGVIGRTGTIRLDAAAEDVQVATVLRALQRDAGATGRLSAIARLRGSRAAPEIVGQLDLRDARLRGMRAPDANAGLRYASRMLDVDVTMRDSAGRRVLSGNASLPVDLALERTSTSRRLRGPIAADVILDTFDLAALPIASRSVSDVRGHLVGNAHARGTWERPHFSGNVALGDGGALIVGTGMHVTDAAAGLRLIGDTLRLDSLVARAKGSLRASGMMTFGANSHPVVRMTAQGSDLRVFDATRGLVDADGEINAEGPLSAVHVTGRAEMRDGFLALKQFRKDLLRVKAPGELSFFTVYDTTTPGVVSLQRAAALTRPPAFGMIADLSLVVDRGNYYRNRPDANTEFYTGDGEELRAHIDTRSDDAWAVGFVRIGEGIAIFRARDFEPARGSLTFSSYTGGPGYIEQVGEHLIWEPGRGMLPLQLLTGGTSQAPALGLEAGTLFPIRGRELNGYLTVGRDHSSLLQQSGSSLSGSPSWSGQLSGETGALARRQQAATALGVVLHDIGTGATKEFGLDAFSVSPSDVPTELVFGKTGGVRGAVIEGGRYLTLDRYVGGQVRLTTAIPGARLAQRVGDAYRLDVVVEPRFLFRAPEDLGITHPTVRTGVFGTFLTRWWDW
ncbi:MAG TPA: hypothetical protein VGG84_12535 [Gemmatimonadaceae bacterium]